MDDRAVHLLARDLATPGVHDRLNDLVGWRRVLWCAIDGSENHRAILRGVRDDLAARAESLWVRADEERYGSGNLAHAETLRPSATGSELR